MRRRLLIGGGVAALLLAAGVGLGASGLVAQAAGIPAVQAAAPTLNSWRGANNADHGPEMRGGAFTVTKVSGQTITATRRDGTNATIHVSASTKIDRAGASVSLSAITSGATIGVMGARNSDGSIAATRIEILLPTYTGQVKSISGGDITIQGRDGTHVIHTNGATTVREAGQASSLNAIATGDNIVAMGTKNSDGSLTAEAITVAAPMARGQIKSISGSTITLTTPHGGTMTVQVTSGTKYVSVTFGANGPAQAAAAFSSLKSGVYIVAVGAKNSDGSLNAATVTILPAGRGDFGGRPGGPGDHDGGGWQSGAPAGPPPTTTAN